jgi:ELWxxDGT repeat protein
LEKQISGFMRKKLLYHRFTVSSAVKRFARVLVSCLALVLVSNFTLAQIQLLKDVATREDPFYNEYRYLTKASNLFYYVSNNELWRSNGTTSGTQLVKAFKEINNLTPVGTTLYFAADNGTSGLELWKTNGTASGTVMVKDIYPGASASALGSITNVNGTIYFSARNATNGREIWKTNGTAAGTVLVSDIIKGSGSSNPAYLTNLNGLLLFVANDGQRGYELWKSNGTAAGTLLVKDIRPALKTGSLPQYLTAIGTTVYFGAIDDSGGRELWKTNGTTAGTVRVKDIRPGTTGADVENLININGVLFFTANDGIHGDELWKSNGTSTGTLLVKDLYAGSKGSNNIHPDGPKMGNFTNINGLLYFTASKDYQNFIYRSNGTATGTVTVAEIPWSDGFGGHLNSIPFFTYLNGYVYFYNFQWVEENYYYEPRLFRMVYNGLTPQSVLEIFSDLQAGMINFSNMLYTINRPARTEGYKLLKSDGTAAGTLVLKDNAIITEGSNISKMLAMNGYVFFQPQREPNTPELWRTDGTTAGTIRLGDIWAATNWRVSANHLYWINNASEGWQLWKTQGTTASTILVKQDGTVDDDGYNFPPDRLVDAGGTLYFSTRSSGQLWRSDGTTEGTVMIKDFHAIPHLYASGDKAYIVVWTPSGTEELWKADATGVFLVKTLRTSAQLKIAWYYPSITIGDVLYFVTQDDVHGNELWRTDGTAAGTYMAYDFSTYDELGGHPKEYGINSVVQHNGVLYVSATDNERDVWLWKQTAAQSFEKVKEIYGHEMVSHNGLLYNFGRDNRDWLGNVLWVTDGTTEGFRLLAEYDGDELFPDWAIIGDVIYFNGMFGSSLWRTDGTECGTFKVSTGLQYPWPAEALGSALVFTGFTQKIGSEPYVYHNINSQVPSPCAASSTAAVANEEQSQLISAYPNPYTQEFSLRLSGNDGEQADIAIFTNTGLPVETIRGIKANTDYDNIGATWPRGIYIVKVSRAGKVSTHMVVKK